MREALRRLQEFAAHLFPVRAGLQFHAQHRYLPLARRYSDSLKPYIKKFTDEQILEKLDRHLCRCCGYTKILKAVRRAAAKAGR